MDMQKAWEKALRETEIIRYRIKGLATFGVTEIPYVFLAESSLNIGDTVIRKGKIIVDKPSIILPRDFPQFEGFEFGDEYRLHPDDITGFLYVRGVSFPSLKYNNQTSSIDIFEGALSKAISLYKDDMEKREDLSTGLVVGPEDIWQFSMLIFIASVISRSAADDIHRLLEKFKRD